MNLIEEGVKFCDWPEQKVHEYARRNITGYLARLRRMFYAHEASLHEGLETAEARREHARLEALHELWSRRTDELEDLAKREGFEAVMPALRYRP